MIAGHIYLGCVKIYESGEYYHPKAAFGGLGVPLPTHSSPPESRLWRFRGTTANSQLVHHPKAAFGGLGVPLPTHSWFTTRKPPLAA